jgi:sulfide dehydrogenase cytochrome subunit
MAQPVALPTPQFAPPNLAPKGVMALAESCAICHGPEGRPASGSRVAPLAGRRERDLVQAMREFKEGTRQATVMHQIAKGYSDAEIDALARWFHEARR